MQYGNRFFFFLLALSLCLYIRLLISRCGSFSRPSTTTTPTRWWRMLAARNSGRWCDFCWRRCWLHTYVGAEMSAGRLLKVSVFSAFQVTPARPLAESLSANCLRCFHELHRPAVTLWTAFVMLGRPRFFQCPASFNVSPSVSPSVRHFIIFFIIHTYIRYILTYYIE